MVVAGAATLRQQRRSVGCRFTPADAIDICYPNGEISVCTSHAMQFIDTAQSGEIPSAHVSILRRNAEGAVEVTTEQHYRQ